MAKHPKTKEAVPSLAGHVGVVIDSSIEGRVSPSETIRTDGRRGGKKGAGDIGGSNVNHV